MMKGKKVTVVGLARSGAGAARLLNHMGAVVTVTDKKPEAELENEIRELGQSVKFVLGGHPDEVFNSADLIVISPGISLETGPIASARAMGIPVIGELELAFKAVMSEGIGVSKDKPSDSDASRIKSPFLAVTGSNGKSTTTTLLDLMMKKAGFRTLLGGNIGNALSEEIFKISAVSEQSVTDDDKKPSLITDHLSPEFVVVEVSSFQLEAIESFRPRIASILNITPDHLDRYHSISDYRDAKANIYLNQRSDDFLVLNADDPGTIELYDLYFRSGEQDRPRVFFFSRKGKVEGLYSRDGKIYCSIPGIDCSSHLITVDEIQIKGVHNIENAMAAATMALLAGCPPDAAAEAMKEFGGLEHRLEFVREFNGVRYINDSKGTNVGAVVKSIESFYEPLILIAGGRDKAGDFSMLREPVARNVKAVVLIGEASDKIRKAIADLTKTFMAGDLAEAVKLSCEMAENGDVVLLSPACASFDMFRDFEDRGRQFKKFVMDMKSCNA
jgi:UDP-N-acetylmuramoylalanine--D-glutamate ligase